MPIGYIRDTATREAYRWWEEEGDEAATALFQAFRFIEQQDENRLEDYKRFMRIYENRDYLGLSPSSYAHRRADGRSVFNVTQMVGDTIASRIAKSRPHARAQTVAGNRSMQRKARLQERWVEAEQYRSGLERVAPQVFMDGVRFGTGIFKHMTEGRHIRSERVFPGEVFVDAVEGYEAVPSQYFQRKWVSRDKLCEKFPDHEDALREMTSSGPNESYGKEPLADQLEVVEAWKVKDGPSGQAGYHILAVDGVLLQPIKRWKHEEPPFTFIRWTTPSLGFWGVGLVEELIPLHLDINLTLSQIQKNLRYGNFQVWLDAGGRVKGGKLTNEVGVINTYRGEKPSFHTLNPVSSDLVVHLNQQIERAWAKGGVSPDSVAGQNTLGADASGKARRTFYEEQTQRYSLLEKQWEWLWMDNYAWYLRLGKELSQRFKDYTVVANKDRYTIEQLKWEDVDLEEDSYVIRAAPISALPSLPSDRLAQVQEMFLMGWLSPQRAMRMLDWPDLDEEMSLDRASEDNTKRLIEKMLDEGEYEGPSPFGDLTQATKLVQAAHERAKAWGDVPEDRLKLLRQYLTMVQVMKAKAEAAAVAAQGPLAPGTAPQPGPTGQMPTAVGPADGTL